MTTGYSKSEKMDPWVSKSEGKGTESEPINTKSEPKGSQRKPKGSQREPKGAKREPNADQNQHKIKIKDKVAKRSLKWSHAFWVAFGTIVHQKSMKKTMRKSMPKK